MSIVTTLPAIPRPSLLLRHSKSLLLGASFSALLTPIALLILGYHPYAEDGGLYLTGVKFLLNPSLFPHSRQFVTAPLHYSGFAPFVAFLVRHSGISFEYVVFTLFVVCLWATLLAAWRIAQACFGDITEQIGATLLVALWMSLPVAGTSLMMVDPYLTARSFSTPLVLFAVADALNSSAARKSGRTREARWKIVWATLSLFLAAIFHPLMAGYGAAFVLALFFMEAQRPRSKALKVGALFTAGVLLAAVTQALYPVPSTTITRVALTRSYWFLAQWEWFEIVGLLAPLIILAATLRIRAFRDFQPIARSAVTVGFVAIVISGLFAQSRMANFGVSHLQPLRVFQVIYFALFLALGAWMARTILDHVWWRWGLAVVTLSLPVAIPAWLIFPHSPHIERPLSDSYSAIGSNQWVQAFLWIRRNTPVDAFFAIDANYISDPHEDAQSFRAIAERSVLPDYSKDGGESAVNPSLSEEWQRGVDAQQDLSSQRDSSRYQRLHALGVTWMVLRSTALTSSNCPYNNGTVMVCSLNPPPGPQL